MKVSHQSAGQITGQITGQTTSRHAGQLTGQMVGKITTAFAVLIGFGFGAAGISAHAAVEKMHVDSGSTKFLAVGRPSLLKVRGEGKGPQGDLQVTDGQVTGELKVDIASFNTGIDMRDHHMKEKYLEVEKFPTATLTIKKATIGEMTSLPKDIDFEGELNLHGVSQPVKGKAHVEKQGGDFSFNANFPVKITDHKIDIPTYGGIKIADEVTVDVTSKATDVASATPTVTPAKKDKARKD